MEPTPIPFYFVRDRLELTWQDVAWGYRSGWFDAVSVVAHAVTQLAEDQDASLEVVELAGITQAELADVPFLLEKVTSTSETEGSTASQDKWLYLVLAWVYEHRAEATDPLGLVEQLYADFGYPEEIRAFVRYMPPEGRYEPQAHTHAENVARLLSKWAEYLDSFGVAQCPEAKSR